MWITWICLGKEAWGVFPVIVCCVLCAVCCVLCAVCAVCAVWVSILGSCCCWGNSHSRPEAHDLSVVWG